MVEVTDVMVGVGVAMEAHNLVDWWQLLGFVPGIKHVVSVHEGLFIILTLDGSALNDMGVE